MSDRAEQAKAVIAEAKIDISDADRCILLGISPAAGTLHRRLRDVTAALSASEAEVTRLQAGIRRALTVEDRHTDKAFYVIVGLMVAELEAALSQPTIDTNGAHA